MRMDAFCVNENAYEMLDTNTFRAHDMVMPNNEPTQEPEPAHCPDCDGEGTIEVLHGGARRDDFARQETCPTCDGSGHREIDDIVEPIPTDDRSGLADPYL